MVINPKDYFNKNPVSNDNDIGIHTPNNLNSQPIANKNAQINSKITAIAILIFFIQVYAAAIGQFFANLFAQGPKEKVQQAASDILNLPKSEEKLAETEEAFNKNPESYIESKKPSESGKEAATEILRGEGIKTGLEELKSPKTQKSLMIPHQALNDYKRSNYFLINGEKIIDTRETKKRFEDDAQPKESEAEREARIDEGTHNLVEGYKKIIDLTKSEFNAGRIMGLIGQSGIADLTTKLTMDAFEKAGFKGEIEFNAVEQKKEIKQVDDKIIVQLQSIYKIRHVDKDDNDKTTNSILGYRVVSREIQILLKNDTLDQESIQVTDTCSKLFQNKSFADLVYVSGKI
jgi:hypothetical protein